MSRAEYCTTEPTALTNEEYKHKDEEEEKENEEEEEEEKVYNRKTNINSPKPNEAVRLATQYYYCICLIETKRPAKWKGYPHPPLCDGS